VDRPASPHETDAEATGDDASGDGGPASGVVPKRAPRVVLFALIAVVVYALDVVSKALVAADLPENHRPVRILGGVLYLNQTRNSGAAFSLGAGFTVLLTVVAIAVVGVIVRTAGRMRSAGWAVSLGLILGGALGNLTDRVFRAPGVGRGYVVDWISLFGEYDKYWPIFNLADSAIVCGAVLAAILALFGVDIDGRSARAKHE
jgi:signal peptidase II